MAYYQGEQQPPQGWAPQGAPPPQYGAPPPQHAPPQHAPSQSWVPQGAMPSPHAAAAPAAPKPTKELVPASYNDNIVVEERLDGGRGTIVEILSYKMLRGFPTYSALKPELQDALDQQARAVAFTYAKLSKNHILLKCVKITLNGGSVRTEAGTMHYHVGHVTADAAVGGLGGMLKGAMSSSMNKESAVKPLYSGNGEVYLEPSFKYYASIQLNNETAVCLAGSFLCCDSGVTVGVFKHGVSLQTFTGSRRMFDTKLTGTGWVVLETDHPVSEIRRIRLDNARLCCDGMAAIFFRGDIKVTYEKSMRSFFSTRMGGEGRLHVYSGTGEVWVCPTAIAY